MNAEQIAKSNQEQAVGAWINYLNQVRLDRLSAALSKQNENLTAAMNTIEKAFKAINDEIINRNRGGTAGMHGYIAEIAEVGIGNARRQIIGKSADYIWINDNGPDDLRRGAELIQQKFVQSGGHLSLRAIAEHMKNYPEYLTAGHKYQIPKDHYDKIMAYLEMPEDVANKLPTSTGEFSLKQWKEVHTFFEANNITPNKLEPAILNYGDVQQGTIKNTFEKEKEHLHNVDKEQRDAAYDESKPKLSEGVGAVAVAATVEGITALVMSIVQKRKTGKKISDFDQADWAEIANACGKGAIHGGVRGTSIYVLTNFTATPAAVASAITTAGFSVAEQAHLFRNGEINETQFIENAEILCIDAAISALSSFAGQIIIPIPILGTVIGNTVGMMLYQISKDALSAKELGVIDAYLKDLADLDKQLESEYKQTIDRLNDCFAIYIKLLSDAFDPDVEKAFDGSIRLARYMGVPAEEILDSYDKVASYFLG